MISNKHRCISIVVLLLMCTITFSACSTTGNENAIAENDNASQSQTTSESKTIKTGQHECKFEELSAEVDEDGTQYRYGNLVFSVEAHAGSGSEEVDVTLLAELPLILITDPDGSVRYESHARWLTMRQKWTPSNVHYNPPWNVKVISPAISPRYSADSYFLDFLAMISNDEGKGFTFSGYVEFVPAEL